MNFTFGIMTAAFQKHCLPYQDFVRRIPEYAADFCRLSGSVDVRPSRIRNFIKARGFTLTDDAAVCRATLAAFAAYMRDFHNCRIRPCGILRRSVAIGQGSYSGDLFDLFYRVMFEGLEIPEHLRSRQIIEQELTDAEPGAPPNGGPATPVTSSGVTEGPPSVS